MLAVRSPARRSLLFAATDAFDERRDNLPRSGRHRVTLFHLRTDVELVCAREGRPLAIHDVIDTAQSVGALHNTPMNRLGCCNCELPRKANFSTARHNLQTLDVSLCRNFVYPIELAAAEDKNRGLSVARAQHSPVFFGCRCEMATDDILPFATRPERLWDGAPSFLQFSANF